ncbi:MAG: 4-hydroxyphenylacetate 3-hydroxylase N-terminal domain-containing protein [Bdellovibrionales bacterium]
MRDGKSYLENLAKTPRNVWIDGNKIKSVIEHPATAATAKAVAALYDFQMTHASSLGHEGVAQSLHIPRSKSELLARGSAFLAWARQSGGFLGRTPDYLNSILSAWAGASPYFGTGHSDFARNISNYHKLVCAQDLALTHSVVNAYRVKGQTRVLDRERAMKVVKERDDGILVRGIRHLATSAATCDELLVYSGRISNLTDADADYALSFAVPIGSAGLKLLGREPFDPSRSKFDFPLSSRFEEMDFLVIFEDVFVPWERVFIYRDSAKTNELHLATNSVIHSAHQTTAKSLAKTEFFLGTLLRYINTHESKTVPHIQHLVAEVMMQLEVMKALLRQAEENCAIDSWGVMAPQMMPLEVARVLYMKYYSQLVEVVRSVGAGQLMLLFSQNDLQGEVKGDLERILGDPEQSATDRVRYNRVLWDMACSAFATRQDLYERLYAGGLYPSLQFLYRVFPKQQAEELQDFVDRVLEV